MGKVIRWILGIFLCLLGLITISESVLTGILSILAGLSLIPPVVQRIPLFRERKALSVICCVCLLFAGIIASPDTMGTGTDSGATATSANSGTGEADGSKSAKQKESGKEKEKQEAPVEAASEMSEDNQAESDGSKQEKPVISKKEIKKWLSEKLSQDNPSVSQKEIEKWAQAGEKKFCPVWKKVVLKQIQGLDEDGDFDKIPDKLQKAGQIYKKVCGSGKAIKGILQNAEEFSNILSANQAMEERLDFNIRSNYDSCIIDTYYITQKLEIEYPDNLWGKLIKEAESYTAEDSSDWVAYNVEYVVGEPMCGDEREMVVHADYRNPFPNEGAYYIACYDTGETIELTNDRGFSEEVPVCHLVGNGDDVEGDIEAYKNNMDECYMILGEIEQQLQDMVESSAKTPSAADSTTEGIGSSDYIFADSSIRLLEDQELEGYDANTLSLARNEIYARHGRRFNDEGLQAYFDSKPWYRGTVTPEDFDEAVLSEIEKANIEKIASYE